jgi:hypothetical protein
MEDINEISVAFNDKHWLPLPGENIHLFMTNEMFLDIDEERFHLIIGTDLYCSI